MKLAGAVFVVWRAKSGGAADGRPSTMCAIRSIWPAGGLLTFCSKPLFLGAPSSPREGSVCTRSVEFHRAEEVDCEECRAELVLAGVVAGVPS